MKLTSLVVVSALLGYGHHQANAVAVQSMNKGQSRSTASLKSTVKAQTGVMSLADCESEFQRSGIVLAECQQFLQNASTMKPDPLAAPQVLAQPGLQPHVVAQAEMVHPQAAGTESLSQTPFATSNVWDNSNMAAQAQAPAPAQPAAQAQAPVLATAQPQAQPAATTLGQNNMQAAPVADAAQQQTLMQQQPQAQAQAQAPAQPAQPAQTDVWGLAQRAGPAPTAIAQQSSIPMVSQAPQQLMQAPAAYAAPLQAAQAQYVQAAPVQAAPVVAAQPAAQAAPAQAAAQVEPERPQRDKVLPQKSEEHNPDSTDLTQTQSKEARLEKQENQAKVGQAVQASKDLCDACGAICNIDDLAQLFADIIEEAEDDGEIGTSDILNLVKKANTCVSVQKILMKLPKSKRPDPADVPPVAPQPGDSPDMTIYTNRVPCICGISQGMLSDAEELIKDTYTIDVTVNINRKTGVAVIKDKSGKVIDKYSAFAVEAITNIVDVIDNSDQDSIDVVKTVKQIKQILDTDTGPTDGSGVPTMGMGSGGRMGGMGGGGGCGCCGCCCGGGRSSMSDSDSEDDDSSN